MSTSGSSTAWPPRRARFNSRGKLRNGTWIVPGTGERTRRQFTLRSPNADGPGDDDGYRSLVAQETMKEKIQAIGHNMKEGLVRVWEWSQTQKGRGTIKCSLAYLLASCFTFITPLADFLGKLDGKHIVATIVVYFHPARTAGSQIEAVAIAVCAVLYAIMIGILSMSTSVLIGSVLGSVKLAYAAVLIIYVGGGLGFVGWVKQRLNTPLVSVGASIASIGIITIITKENSVHRHIFSNQKIIQTLKILVSSTTISTAVNLLVWRISARILLRKSMKSASVSLGDMLSFVAKAFLDGSEEQLKSDGFIKASTTYTSLYTQMNKNLKESKYEYYFLGREEIYKHDKALAKSMERLSHSIGGLKSAAYTQFELLNEVAAQSESDPLSPGARRPTLSRKTSLRNRFDTLGAIDEAENERSDEDASPGVTPAEIAEDRQLSRSMTLRTASDMFELFISLLGPSMKSLTHTMAEILRVPPFGEDPESDIIFNEQFKESLEEALSLFNQSRKRALEELYKTIEFGRQRSESLQADFEEVAAACGHFTFSLLSFGDEMQKYMDAVDDLKAVTEEKKRSWKFLNFWKHINFGSKKPKPTDPEQFGLIEPSEEPIRRLRQSAMPRGIPDSMVQRRDTFSWDAASPVKGAYSFTRSISQRLLRGLRVLGRDDIRFGLKVGIGATIYAMFAFIPATRPIYQHWRGEWGLLSFMIVCSMTVGASNTTGLARFLGTIMGACFVVINWAICGENPWGLAVLGWLVSFGTFYIMVDRGNAPFGRFILLSYNVSSLYAYSLTQRVDDDDDDEGGVHPLIRTIAFHRVVAVSIGILWGLIVCRLIWPISARRKFKEGLSVLYLQMGLVWKRGPLAVLLRNDSTRSYMRAGEQAALQRYKTHLQTLHNSAQNERSLRGPFPTAHYSRILVSTTRLLDAFHAMSLVTQKHGRLSDGEKALLYHTADERAQLCARICHIFQVLASSMMLEYPLTDAIPSVTVLRDRLLSKIFQFRKDHDEAWRTTAGGLRRNSSRGSGLSDTIGPTDADNIESGSNGKAPSSAEPVEGTDSDPSAITAAAAATVTTKSGVVVEEPDYALLYAYALVTGQVAKELKVVENEIEKLFGKLDEDAMLLQ